MKSFKTLLKGIYPGWLMVLTGFMAMCLIYPVNISLMSLFIGPIGQSFNVDITVASIQFSLLTFSGMAGAVLAGPILEKLGLKKAMTLAAIIHVIAFSLYAISPSIWVNYFVSIILGLASPTLTSVGIPVMVNTWFGRKLSGNAVGMAMIGSGVGAMILTPIVSAIISNASSGWRAAYMVLAGLILLVYLPMVLLFVKDSPEKENIEKLGVDQSVDATKSVTDDPSYGMTLNQAKSQPIFCLLALTFIIVAMVALIFYTLSFGYFTHLGFSRRFASTLLSIQALALIFGKYSMGTLSDRTNPYIASLIFTAFQLGGFLCIFVISGNQWIAILGMVLFGIGNALGTISIPLLTQSVFGNIQYGQVVGLMNMFAGLGAALGPIFSSSLLNLSGSYRMPWLIGSIGLVLVLVLIVVIRQISSTLEDERRQSLETL